MDSNPTVVRVVGLGSLIERFLEHLGHLHSLALSLMAFDDLLDLLLASLEILFWCSGDLVEFVEQIVLVNGRVFQSVHGGRDAGSGDHAGRIQAKLIVSGAHADESAAVFDHDVHARFGRVHVQSFKYVPQKIVSSKRGNVPFQDAQQQQFPHQKLFGSNGIVRVENQKVHGKTFGLAKFGADEQASGAQQLQVVFGGRIYRQEPVQIVDGQRKYVFLALLLFAYLPHPVDDDLPEIGSEFGLHGGQVVRHGLASELGLEHGLEHAFVQQQGRVLLGDASGSGFATQQIHGDDENGKRKKERKKEKRDGTIKTRRLDEEQRYRGGVDERPEKKKKCRCFFF